MSETGNMFDDRSASRIGGAVRRVERWVSEIGEDRPIGGPPSIPSSANFKIVSAAAGAGKYNLQIMDRPKIDMDATTAIAATDIGLPHTTTAGYSYIGLNFHEIGLAGHALANDDILPGWIHRTQSDKKIFVELLAPALILVTVQKDGGAQGDASTAATWTYTVKGRSGDTLAVSKTPARARSKGLTTFAATGSYGLAHVAGGSLTLLDVYGESAGAEECT